MLRSHLVECLFTKAKGINVVEKEKDERKREGGYDRSEVEEPIRATFSQREFDDTASF